MKAEQTYQQLIQLGRKTKQPGDQLITLYALERVLNRLTISKYSDDFSLKGGVLLAAYNLRRPTRDIDMQAMEFDLDQDHLLEVITAIIAVDAEDGLIFDPENIRLDAIRDEEEYTGIRVHLPATLHRAKVTIKLDISTGDPIHPDPILVTLPGILGQDVTIMGNPLETVIGEKAVTILQRGTTSTRWRDYMDIRTIAKTHSFKADDLRLAAEAISAHRMVTLESTAPHLYGYDAIAQSKWNAWFKKGGYEALCKQSLQAHLFDVSAFVDPVFSGSVTGNATWNPDLYTWETDDLS